MSSPRSAVLTNMTPRTTFVIMGNTMPPRDPDEDDEDDDEENHEATNRRSCVSRTKSMTATQKPPRFPSTALAVAF